MAKAAQQIGQASGQPKARDIAPQAKTEAGGADKQSGAPPTHPKTWPAIRVANSRS